MSDKMFLAMIVMSVAVIIGFMASCEMDRQQGEVEIRKARIEKALDK